MLLLSHDRNSINENSLKKKKKLVEISDNGKINKKSGTSRIFILLFTYFPLDINWIIVPFIQFPKLGLYSHTLCYVIL